MITTDNAVDFTDSEFNSVLASFNAFKRLNEVEIKKELEMNEDISGDFLSHCFEGKELYSEMESFLSIFHPDLVGSTVNVKKRWARYKRLSCKSQTKLFNSLKKHGAENHVFEVITECTQEEMYRLEATYGHLYNVFGKNGLNCRLPENGSFYQQVSDSTRLKLSLSHRGFTHFVTGHKHSEESKLRMSLAMKGKKKTSEHKSKLKIAHIGVINHKRLTFCKETGIYYNTVLEAWETTDKRTTYSYLKQMLLGYKPNKTSFIYA